LTLESTAVICHNWEHALSTSRRPTCSLTLRDKDMASWQKRQKFSVCTMLTMVTNVRMAHWKWRYTDWLIDWLEIELITSIWQKEQNELSDYAQMRKVQRFLYITFSDRRTQKHAHG